MLIGHAPIRRFDAGRHTPADGYSDAWVRTNSSVNALGTDSGYASPRRDVTPAVPPLRRRGRSR
jgi:hypothetical protein